MATIRERTWTNAKGVVTKRWQVDFVDQDGHRRHKQFRQKKAADAYLVAARSQVASGTYVAESGSPTIQEAAEAWLTRGKAEQLERSTIWQREHHIAHILAVIDPDIRLARISVTRLEQARDELLLLHSRVTARKIVVSLRAILKQAKAVHLATANLTVKGAARHRRRLEVGTDIPTPEDVKALVESSTGAAWALICLAAFAGLRASEIRGLRWIDLKLGAHPTVTVSQRADRWGTIGSPKSDAAKRTIPLSAVTVQALRSWKLEQPPGRALVFGTSSDRPETLPNIRARLLSPTIAKAGVRWYGLHSFRHYAISAWLRTCGGDFKVAQVWAGHSTLTMTLDRYGHLLPASKRTADAELGMFG
jgi:integrase